MDKDGYLDLLIKKHSVYYDVYRDYELNGEKLDIYAEFHARNERYVLIDVLDAYETHEYRMIKYYRDLEIKYVEDYVKWLESLTGVLIKPHSEHMCTTLTGIIVTDNGIDKTIENYIKKYKYTKYYSFGIKGWGEIRLVCVDLASNRAVANRKGREVIRDFAIPMPKSQLLINKEGTFR